MTDLYPFQREGVDWLHERGGKGIIGDEQGLGKTIQFLRYAVETGFTRILVICPAYLKWNWQREAKKHVGLQSIVLESHGARRCKLFTAKNRLVIVNYDIMRSWLPILQRARPQLVGLDEVQYIKNMRAIRTKATVKMCDSIPCIVPMSGTAIENRPIEMYTALKLVDPVKFGSFRSYAFRYCNPQLGRWGWDFKGHSNLKELHVKVKDVMIRRLKKDVLKDLPDKRIMTVTVDIDDRKTYEKAINDFIEWLRSVNPGRVPSAMKAQQISQLTHIRHLVGTLKSKRIIDWTRDFLGENPKEKLLVFCIHHDVVNSIYSQFENIGVKVTGKVTGRKRQELFDQFQNCDRTRLMVGNIEAAGTGWNATRAANVLFGELAWTPAKHAQAVDRTHRIGQDKQVQCYYMLARDTIEEKHAQLLRRKQEIVNAVLDGEGVENQFDVFDEITSYLRGFYNEKGSGKKRQRRGNPH